MKASAEGYETFARHIEQLRAGGCWAAAVTPMGGHFCINELKAISPLPIIDVVPALDAFFSGHRAKCVGVLGTRKVMETKLYGVAMVEVIGPDPDQIDDVRNAYLRIAASGIADEMISEFFIEAGERLCQAGAELIVLGGPIFLSPLGAGSKTTLGRSSRPQWAHRSPARHSLTKANW